jgi:BirA family biotin operon repressor/biotin-[acetyl-CoA-carboxylase] ligase
MASFQLDGYPFVNADWIPSIVHLTSIDSTNDFARERARHFDVSLPLLVLSDTQTAGRGRHQNRWWTGQGGIALTIAVPRSSFAPRQPSLLSLDFGLAVRNAITRHIGRDRVTLKWPNDILVDRKKVSGILIENIAGIRPLTMAGIGINLNNDLAEFPHEILDTATTVAQCAGRPIERPAAIDQLLGELRQVVEGVRTDQEILRDYRASHGLTDQHLVVRQGDQSIEGRCVGIDDDGSLLLDGPSGLSAISSGTVVSHRVIS